MKEQMPNKDELSITLEKSKKETEQLLEMYKRYLSLYNKIKHEEGGGNKGIGNRLKGFLSSGTSGKMINFDPLIEEKKQLESIGQAMKFQNPFIWLLYKFTAYKNTDSELKTVSDIKKHCEIDGICTKRFDFINKYLRDKYGQDFYSDLYSDNMVLDKVLEDRRFRSLLTDREFMTNWSKNENYAEGKWKSYVLNK